MNRITEEELNETLLTSLEFGILWEGCLQQKDVSCERGWPKLNILTQEEGAARDELWEAVKQGAKISGEDLPDGPLCSLMGFDSSDPKELILRTNITDYRDFIYTCARNFYGAKADPIYTSVMLFDDFGTHISTRLSDTDRFYPNKVAPIGGFMNFDDSDADGVPDPFLTISRVLLEKTGLRVRPEDFYLIGITYNLVLHHPQLVFLAAPSFLTDVLFDKITEKRRLSDPDHITRFQWYNGLVCVPGKQCRSGLKDYRKVLGVEATPTMKAAAQILTNDDYLTDLDIYRKGTKNPVG